jgi:hypothetical protein
MLVAAPDPERSMCKISLLLNDPQLRDSYMPHILSGNARFFKIHGKTLVGERSRKNPGAVLFVSLFQGGGSNFFVQLA